MSLHCKAKSGRTVGDVLRYKFQEYKEIIDAHMGNGKSLFYETR